METQGIKFLISKKDESDFEESFTYLQDNSNDDEIDKNIKELDQMIADVTKMRRELKSKDLINPTIVIKNEINNTPSVKNKTKLKEIPHKIIYSNTVYNLNIKLDKNKDNEFNLIREKLYKQENIMKEKNNNILYDIINKTDSELEALENEIDEIIKLGEDIDNILNKIN